MSDTVKSAVKSVLRPGVELGLDDGTVNVIARLSDIARGEIAGYNASVLGSYRQLFPRLSKKDYLKLAYTDLPDSPMSLRDVLLSIPGLRERDIREFSLARRLARQDLGDGSYRDVVVPNIKHLATEMDLADYDELDGIELEEIPGLAQRARVRTYTLTQVMSDQDIKQKYNLPVRVWVTGERLAATDAPAAAQVFQDAMNSVQETTRVKVVAGALAVDNVQASNSIRMMAYGAPALPTSIKCDLVAGKLFMYAPDDSDVAWHILGPARRATDLMELYRIVCAQGPILPSGLLAVDLVQLKLDIFDGESYMEPVMQFNAAVGDGSMASAGLSESAAREMTASQRAALAAMGNKLLPVMDRFGRQLATAVRVTDRHVLVNDHVHAADANATVSGRRLSLSYRVARDVWSAECLGSGAPWVYRDPVVGETAIVLYVVDGVVSCSSPVVVEAVNSDTVMTSGSGDVVRGVSGGALVSLKDFALFGVHSASVGSSLLNYRFGSDQLEELIGHDSMSPTSRVASVSNEGETFAATVVRRFAEKGLNSTFRSICTSVAPLWQSGVHVGMSLLDAGMAYTTLPVDTQYFNREGTQVYKFEKAEGDLASAVCPWSTSRLPLRRNPRLGEKVFIVCFDDEPYITDQTEVSHTYAGGKGFVLRHIPGLDKPVAGGAVVAWDGAVLGLAGAEFSFDTPVGYGLKCKVLIAEPKSPVPSARNALAIRFPFLRMDLWPDDLLEEAFTHSSACHYLSTRVFNVGNKPLAIIGDAFMRYLNGKVMRDHDVPHSDWANHMQELQSNSVMAPLVHKLGIENCVITGKGVVLQRGSKPYADIIEALIGAAALVESEATVLKFASELGLIYDEEKDRSVVNVSEAAVD